MGRKIVRISLAGLLIATAAVALSDLGDRGASATDRAPVAARIPSARGMSVSVTLKDYTTRQELDCGGTYTLDSWVWGVVRASSRTSGLARLVYRTNEGGTKYWNTKSGTVYLSRRSSVVGELNQWPEGGGERQRFRFTVELYREGDPNGHPQATTRCTITVSKS